MTSLARIATYIWLGYSNKRICELFGADLRIVKAVRKGFI
jgi:hypothetical protein